MANTWADQLKAGDMVNVGDLGDSLIEYYDGDPCLPNAAWLEVIGVRPGDDGFTDVQLRDEDGTVYGSDIPSGERVTVRRA